MKKVLLNILVVITTIFGLTFISSKIIHAQTGKNIKTATLMAEETINKDYYTASDIVNVNGNIVGDLYAAGGEVNISGNISKDALVAGGKLIISGNVNQDLRVVGGQIQIIGTVKGNLTVAGGQVEITKDAKILGNVTLATGEATIAGEIQNLTAAGGTITISGKVDGDVTSYVGQLRVASGSEINGNINYFSDNSAQIEEGAVVKGEATQNMLNIPQRKNTDQIRLAARKAVSTFRIIGLLSFLVIGLIISKIHKNYSLSVSSTLEKRPWASLAIGFLALMATPITVIILFITIIGAPIAAITLPLYFIANYVSKYFVMLWAGEKILAKNKQKTIYTSFILGLIIYSVLTFIPIVSGFTKFFTLLFGLGAMLITCKETHVKATKAKII